MSKFPVTMNLSSEVGRFHSHIELEIIFIISGEGKLTVNDKEYTVKKGDLRIIVQENFHRMDSDSDILYFSLFIDTSFFNQYIPNIQTVYFQCVPEKTLAGRDFESVDNLKKIYLRIISMLIDEERDEAHDIILETVSLLNNLRNWFTLLDNYLLEDHDEEQFNKIWEIINFVYDNCTERLPLTAVAQHFYLSPNYLSHLFKQMSGLSYVENLNHCRSEYALKMLIETKCSMTKIAQETGFSSLSYFRKYFFQFYNTTPEEFRSHFGQVIVHRENSGLNQGILENVPKEEVLKAHHCLEEYLGLSAVRRIGYEISADMLKSKGAAVDSGDVCLMDTDEIFLPTVQQKLENILSFQSERIVKILNNNGSVKANNSIINGILKDCKIKYNVVQSVSGDDIFLNSESCPESNLWKSFYTKNWIPTPRYYFNKLVAGINKKICFSSNGIAVAGNSSKIDIAVNNTELLDALINNRKLLKIRLINIEPGRYEKIVYIFEKRKGNLTKIYPENNEKADVLSTVFAPRIYIDNIILSKNEYNIEFAEPDCYAFFISMFKIND